MFHRLSVVVFLFVSVLVAAAPDAGAQPAPGGSLIALAQNLKVEVTETGPEQLWTLHLSNLGDFPIGLVADPGLLWFKVEVPGRSTPQICRLPGPLWPKIMRRRAQLVLQPGQRFSRRFDARFFCFADLTQTVLVPGARVAPFFGWPLETREVRVKGKRTTETLPPRAPFVAWALQTPEKAEADATTESKEGGPLTEGFDADGGEGLGGDDSGTEPAPKPPTEGVKHISGATFVLSPAYARWSQPLPELSPGLHTLMLAGSDAEDERNVTITVSVLNTSNVPQQIFVRRELVSYDVTGPDGTFHCATTDLGTPDIASFTTLASQRSERFVVRLIEMCPRGSFSRPGLYEVHAALEAKHGGQAVGFDAFVGTLTAPRPALVRVRSGDRSSFLRPTPMLAGAQAPGGTAPGPGRGAAPTSGPENDAPMEGSPDGLPQEDLPLDPGGAMPDEGPAPQSPNDGTVVE